MAMRSRREQGGAETIRGEGKKHERESARTSVVSSDEFILFDTDSFRVALAASSSFVRKTLFLRYVNTSSASRTLRTTARWISGHQCLRSCATDTSWMSHQPGVVGETVMMSTRSSMQRCSIITKRHHNAQCSSLSENVPTVQYGL